MNAGKSAAIVTVSRAGINVISRMIPLGQSAPMRAAAQLVATGAVGWGVSKFLGNAAGDLAMIAGIDALYTSVIRNLNVPVLSGALGDDVIQGYYLGPGGIGDTGDMGAYYNGGVSTLPAGGGGLGGYVGDDAEAALISQ